MKRTIAAVSLAVTGLGLMAAPAVAGQGHGPAPKVWICHATSSDTNPYTIINVSTNSTKYEGHLAHKTEPNKRWKSAGTYGGVEHAADQPKPDIIGEPGAAKPPAECGPTVVVTPPPVTQTVTVPPVTVTETVPAETVTETVTAPPVTKTETVTPTETVTETAPPVTETVTPTETVTAPPVTETLPPVEETVVVPGPTHTVEIPGPESVVPVKVAGPVVTKTVVGPATTETVKAPGDKVVVNEKGEVQSVQRTTLPYTGFNLTIFLIGLCLLLAGTTLGFGAKLIKVRAH